MDKIVTGIMAHVDAGKTTLSEQILFHAKAIRKLGRVDDRDSFLDNNDMERERGITIFSKLARFCDADKEVILVDTPGHIDFSAETERALLALDVAILLISSLDGVTAHTKTLWNLLSRHNIPTFIFVNKMDLGRASKDELMQNIRENLTDGAVDFSEENETLYEDIASNDEVLLEQYLNDSELLEDEISAAVMERKVFPVFFGSALKGDGVSEFLNRFLELAKVPTRPETFGAFVYKIDRDKSNNRETVLKITGGSLRSKMNLGEEKVNEIRVYNADKYVTVPEAFAGDIVSLTGLTESQVSTCYGNYEKTFLPSMEPVLLYSVCYPDGMDGKKVKDALTQLEEEEPNYHVEFNEETRELSVRLMGEVQTEILKREMADRYQIPITFGVGKIAYKETISSVVEGVGHFEPLRHYAEVHLRMEPSDPGSGLTFISEVSTDDLALNWQRLILTHLKEKVHRGVLTASPITDMNITLVSGRAHLKHTEGGDFRQATYRAVRQGLMQAKNVLLEPYYNYEITLPKGSVGRAMTDLESMAASVKVSEQYADVVTLTGTAPVSTMNGYAQTLRSYTSGAGTLSVSFSGYEPCHNAEEVIASIGYDPERDLRNTPDSVFCSHGAGTVVPWYEVFEWMHLPLEGENTCPDEETISLVRPSVSEEERFVSVEEIDEILHKSTHANEKGRKGAYKGMSESLRNRRRDNTKPEAKEVVYKGSEAKEKFMLIDGYNVIHAWPELSDLANADMNAAAGRLMDIVSNYQGIIREHVILVFDAYKVPGHPTEVIAYHNITVVYTKTAETADHYIERYAHENGKRYDITVVTSDGVEQVIIRGNGCRLLSSREFEAEVERANFIFRNENGIL